jgi:hypothetical protein
VIPVWAIEELRPNEQARLLRSMAYFFRDEGDWEMKFCCLISASRAETRVIAVASGLVELMN